MSELLPTPTAGDGKSSGSRNLAGSKAHDGVSLTDAILHGNSTTARRTSASSQGSVAWISRWKRRGIPASDRLSGTPTAPASLSDGGRLFPVGEMSRGSALLPTPKVPLGGGERSKERAGTGDLIYMARYGMLTSSSEDSPASPPPPPVDGREPPMIAGSGRSSPVSLASYDPALSSWRTFQASLLSTEDERFPRSWERWPTSGMTRRGRAFALPMSARPTDGNGSSYLPTPTTRDWKDDHRASPGYTREKLVPNLAAQIEDELLPTPKTPTGGSEARAGRQARGSGGEDLEARLHSLGDLTTPRSDDGSEP